MNTMTETNFTTEQLEAWAGLGVWTWRPEMRCTVAMFDTFPDLKSAENFIQKHRAGLISTVRPSYRTLSAERTPNLGAIYRIGGYYLGNFDCFTHYYHPYFVTCAPNGPTTQWTVYCRMDRSEKRLMSENDIDEIYPALAAALIAERKAREVEVANLKAENETLRWAVEWRPGTDKSRQALKGKTND